MRVALISDSPTLPTGFARTTRALVKALTDIGHEVSCFGLGGLGEKFDPTLYRCKIWPAGENNEESNETFSHFMASEKPDAVLINYDLVATLRWLELLGKVAPAVPVISHLIIDGLPVYPGILRLLNRCVAILAATECARRQVAEAVSPPVYCLPHMVNCEKFHPWKGAEIVKRALFPDSLVVGVIAQNRSRKQLVQTIHAIRLLRDAGRDVVLLLHTNRIGGLRFGGHPLRKIVESFGVEDIVHITETHKRTDAVAEDAAGASSRFGVSLNVKQLDALTVTERLNLCDVVVVASAYGGFEYVIIEAQSCGVPVCVTDDGASMMEVAGNACEPLQPSLFEFTDYGAKIWKIAPETIATAISKIADDPGRRQALQAAGLQNAKRYDDATNEAAFAATLEKILGSLPVPRRN